MFHTFVAVGAIVIIPTGMSTIVSHKSRLRPGAKHRRPIALFLKLTLSSTGFAAHLSAAQAFELQRHPAVLTVVLDKVHHLHTTRTPQFMGLEQRSGLWPKSHYASNVIIGVLDTGIWPELPSFSDEGYDPLPVTWKGSCEVGPHFPATSSSTAAGSVVPNAGLFDYARGEAMGMAIKARIAAYKICWTLGCYDSDMLAAIDQAIADGVHNISLSVGVKKSASSYVNDNIAIGDLHVAQRGVLMSCSAGKSGPNPFTAVNIAPWILTVGASTIDREFSADIELGDGRKFRGASLYAGEALDDSVLKLVNGADCGSRFCIAGELNSSKVTGKMVICDRGGASGRVAKDEVVKQAGGVAMILTNTAESGEELIADSHIIPATLVGQSAGDQIKDYVSSVPNPTATIKFKGTVTGPSPSAPRVAAFSSRGPNRVTPEILKPDVIGPGVNILAGWTGAVGSSGLKKIDQRRVEFNVMSGTSMSCPHISGLAALLRNTYPSWCPAAVKSALMTTAYYLDNSKKNFTDLATGKQSSEFVHGSGHVDPNKALNPGLVYDIDVRDYIAFLCSIRYGSKDIAIFLKDPATIDCGANNLSSPGNLNYPSFSVVFESGKTMVKYTRVVKNVGALINAVYNVTVNKPLNVDVSVSPRKLNFSAKKQKLSYDIIFTSTKTDQFD
uniref:Uncharacterized protein n=1 Tax=Chenopodium quinoa TaxID=63459 RepID=A0A803KR05_CHEQI